MSFLLERNHLKLRYSRFRYLYFHYFIFLSGIILVAAPFTGWFFFFRLAIRSLVIIAWVCRLLADLTVLLNKKRLPRSAFGALVRTYLGVLNNDESAFGSEEGASCVLYPRALFMLTAMCRRFDRCCWSPFHSPSRSKARRPRRADRPVFLPTCGRSRSRDSRPLDALALVDAECLDKPVGRPLDAEEAPRGAAARKPGGPLIRHPHRRGAGLDAAGSDNAQAHPSPRAQRGCSRVLRDGQTAPGCRGGAVERGSRPVAERRVARVARHGVRCVVRRIADGFEGRRGGGGFGGAGGVGGRLGQGWWEGGRT